MTVATAGSPDGDQVSLHVKSPWTHAWNGGSLQSVLVIVVVVIVFGELMCSIIIC